MSIRQLPKTIRLIAPSSCPVWKANAGSPSRGIVSYGSSQALRFGFGHRSRSRSRSRSRTNSSLVFSRPGAQTLRGLSTGDKTSDDESSSKQPPPPAVANNTNTASDDAPGVARELFDASSRGVGQVLFLNSRKAGQILGVGLFLGDPYLAGLAALGTVSATATARAAGLDGASIENGLLGYNGCLVGCAAAVFGAPSVLAATTATILGASATPFVALSLKEAMGGVPQWTFAFNAVALTSLLKTRPLLPPPPPSSSLTAEITAAAETTSAAEAVVTASKGSVFADVLASPLTGVSQIFVVQSPLSGAIILGGIGSYSPLLAVHALGGSTLGTLVGALGGAPLEELTMGLYGFNSALTSMAVGVFFVHSTPSMMLSAGGAAATASLFGAMKTVFGAYGAPCLTLPFCVTMSACYLLQKHVPGLVPATTPHSPEKNE